VQLKQWPLRQNGLSLHLPKRTFPLSKRWSGKWNPERENRDFLVELKEPEENISVLTFI
jgi:hypothetical protein